MIPQFTSSDGPTNGCRWEGVLFCTGIDKTRKIGSRIPQVVDRSCDRLLHRSNCERKAECESRRLDKMPERIPGTYIHHSFRFDSCSWGIPCCSCQATATFRREVGRFFPRDRSCHISNNSIDHSLLRDKGCAHSPCHSP